MPDGIRNIDGLSARIKWFDRMQNEQQLTPPGGCYAMDGLAVN